MQLNEYEGVVVDLLAGVLYIDFLKKNLAHSNDYFDAQTAADRAYYFAHQFIIARDRYIEEIAEL